MAEHETDPHDDRVSTVPLPTNVGDGTDRVIAQQNHSPEVALGGGEWPSPGAPPTGPAQGAAGKGRGQAPASGDGADDFPPMKDVLEADPVAAGSRSVPDEDDEDGVDQRWGGSRLG